MTTKILIVEDDPMVSSINSQYLQKIFPANTLQIYSENNATDALKIVQTLEPNLILLDIYLPKISGTDLLKLFIKNNLHPNVIMLTAANDAQHISQAIDYGILDYLVKPFTYERFKKSIVHFLNFNKTLNQDKKLSQTQLDQLFITKDIDETSHADQLPKGLSEYSLKKIKQAIKQTTKPFSNQDIARKSLLSRISTKKYLDFLEKNGDLTAQIHYLKIGRPVKMYKSNL